MLDAWCYDASDCQPLAILGAIVPHQIPDVLYGTIGALLSRSLELGVETLQLLAGLQVTLPDRSFHVVLLALDDPKLKELAGIDRHNCSIHLYSGLREHMIGFLDGKADGLFVLMNGYLIGLVYPKSDPACVAECCGDVRQYAMKEMGVSCHVTASTAWDGIENIERAFKMVSDIEASRKFYEDLIEPVFVAPESAIRRLTDTDQRTRSEQAFFPVAERICGTVRAGDTAGAARELHKQLRQIAEHCIGLPYPNALNLSINRFFSLIQFRLMEEELADWRHLVEADFSRELISRPTLSEFLDASAGIAEKLIAHAKERMDSRHANLMREIRAYLEENAADMNLGLTSVARTFHITPREAAESFRAFYGLSINDIVHRIRVKRAKELLLTTNDSVQDIAAAVGYCSLATMYRAFTNIEGVAPGKLRQNRGGQNKK